MTVVSPSSPPRLVVVLGAPATGKTTLAHRLAGHLSLPLMTKDTIKELLYDILGAGDVAWSRRLGHASTLLLLQFAEAHVVARQSCVVECNFYAEHHAPRLLELKERHPYEPVQVLCRAGYPVVVERYRRRAESGERHPGHLDQTRVAELDEAKVQAQCQALPIGGEVIEVDTTDFAAVDYGALLARVGALCDRP